jgi:16S rRNA (cytosine1402-N4)-methyltransferase
LSEARAEHEPVLVEAVLRLLDPAPGHVLLDATVGLGGHAAALLPRIMPGGRYVGIDVDAAMVSEAGVRLSAWAPPALELIVGNYADFVLHLERLGIEEVDGMLLDLGVNSAQLADPARGFSFDRDGPLDMRFDRSAATRALDLVNALPETELADLFYRFGGEGLSRKIAKRICQVRHEGRITSTRVLARAVESAVSSGRPSAPGRIHPATRVFQALRVSVNRELENLERFLSQAPSYLRRGGRLVVISFHSLEDGLVKRFVRQGVASGTLTDLAQRPVVAGPPERARNARSRSAKLRAAQRR